MPDKYQLSEEDLKKIREHDAVKKRCYSVGHQLADHANEMARAVSRPSERDRDNFGVYIVKQPGGGGPKCWVHPLGKTGIHIEAAHSVLLKAIGMIR